MVENRQNLGGKKAIRKEIELGLGWERCRKWIFRNQIIFSRGLRYDTS